MTCLQGNKHRPDDNTWAGGLSTNSVIKSLRFRRIKQKKIYVISTLKRPVPLEHYLYTGNSNKTSNELFMIVDAKKQFLQRG